MVHLEYYVQLVLLLRTVFYITQVIVAKHKNKSSSTETLAKTSLTAHSYFLTASWFPVGGWDGSLYMTDMGSLKKQE